MNQWLKFDPLVVFRLLKRMNGSDLDYGATRIQKWKKRKEKKRREFRSSGLAITWDSCNTCLELHLGSHLEIIRTIQDISHPFH